MSTLYRISSALMLTFALLQTAFAQNYFQKYYRGTDNNYATAIVGLPNGDLVLAGGAGPDVLSRQIWVMRVKPDGSPVWSKIYDVDASAQATALTLGPDGNLLLVYSTVTTNPVTERSGWMKISADGEVLWAKKDIGESNLSRIRPAKGGGYYLSGYYESPSSGWHYRMVVHISEAGDVLWATVFGDVVNNAVTDFWEDDLGFIHCTGYVGEIAGNIDGFWAKLGSNGAIVGPVLQFGTSGSDHLTRIVPFGPDRLLMCGASTGFSNYSGIWMVVTDYSGAVKSSYLLQLPEKDIVTEDLIALPGDQFLLSAKGLYPSFAPAILIKFSIDLDQLFAFQYKGGNEADGFQQVLQHNNGYSAAGFTQRNGDSNTYLVRTDKEGNLNNLDCCPVALTITRQPVQPEVQASVPSQTAFFSAQSLVVTAQDLPIEAVEICRPIELEFSLSKDTICPGECVEVMDLDSTDNVLYQFDVLGGTVDPADAKRFCHGNAPAFFITRVGDNGTCSKSLSKQVALGSKADHFPNAFTPNGDGSNDVFRPVFYCKPSSLHLRIYNRWGNLVFETYEPEGKWDGKVNDEPATSDVYVWKLDYTLENNGTRTDKHEQGQVTLLR